MLKRLFLKFKGLISLITGNIGAQLIGILMIPIIARIFSPEDIGQLSLLISILAIINVFSTLKLELALPLEAENKKLVNLISASFIILLFVVIITFIAVHGLLINDLLSYNLVFYLLPLMLLGDGIYNLVVYFSIRFENYKGIAISKISKSLITSGSQISFGLVKSNSLSLILGDILGRILGANRLLVKVVTFIKEHKNEISLRNIASAIREYKKFPLLSAPSAFLNSSSLQLFPIFIGLFFNNYYLGIYAMGQRILVAPLGFISQAIGQFFLGNATKLVRSNNIKQLKAIFMRYLIFLLLFSGSIVSIILIFSEIIINFFLGNNWIEVNDVIKAISLMVVIQFAVSPLSQILNVLKKQEIQLYWDAFRFTLVIAMLFCSQYFELTFINSVELYSYILIFSYLCLLIIIFSLFFKMNKTSLDVRGAK
ncbi:lipopolysaccharide biosynthesis protein [Sporosarcina sp. 179-K 8C2 HS]|uniref:lipopolysaccharide biosynthesis protein n=1 Tax=Sporosarcina sp. 179-K 8C2 HS TaxID=3142387 RepID=UPI0039A22F5E